MQRPKGHGIRPQSKTSKERISRCKRQTAFMKARLEGKSFEEIGAQFGVSTQRAFKIVKDESALLNRKRAETAEECIRLELSRLDEMFKPLWAKAKKGDMQAQASCLRIMERRSKLLGLDLADGKEDSGQAGTVTVNIVEEVVHVNGKPIGSNTDTATSGAGRLPPEWRIIQGLLWRYWRRQVMVRIVPLSQDR